MIQTNKLTKKFDDIMAVDQVTAVIKPQNVFGLIGTNGAGKSTFLRLASGILKPTSGNVTVDGEDIFENIKMKERIFYISDDQHFFSNATPVEVRDFYSKIYRQFDKEQFNKLLNNFGLDPNRKINTFSKGMKKQVSIACGVCANTEYLFCDETFDGLDPVMRQAVKSIFAKQIEERGLTPVVASHNLRELEDICDHVGLLHKGGILLSKDLDEMKLCIHRVQCILNQEEDLSGFEIVKQENRGKLVTLTIRGSADEIREKMEALDPIFYEMLPLSLEEIFISETEVAGYDIKNLIFDK